MVVVRRDTLKKESIAEADASEKVPEMLEKMQKEMFAKAKKELDKQITEVKEYKELRDVIEKAGGFVKAGWCGSEDCESKIKDETGATIRVIGSSHVSGKCVYCGKKSDDVAYFARSY